MSRSVLVITFVRVALCSCFGVLPNIVIELCDMVLLLCHVVEMLFDTLLA